MTSIAAAEASRHGVRGPFFLLSASAAASVFGVHVGQVIPLEAPYPQNMWEMLAKVVFSWQSVFWFLAALAPMAGYGFWDPAPTHETPAQSLRWHVARLRANNRFPLGAILILALLSYPFWVYAGVPPVGMLAVALGLVLIVSRHLILNTGIANQTVYLFLWFATGWVGSGYFSGARDATLPCKANAEVRLISGEALPCMTVDVLAHYDSLLFRNGNTALYVPLSNVEEASFVAATEERAILLFPDRDR